MMSKIKVAVAPKLLNMGWATSQTS